MKFTYKWMELEKIMLNEEARAQKILALNVGPIHKSLLSYA